MVGVEGRSERRVGLAYELNEILTRMSCFENCERDWLLGARGVCNATINGTLECICPEFFSGNDDWQRFDDSCQVDERIQQIVHSVIVGLITLSCLFIAAAILFFACETGFATMPEVPDNVKGSIAFTRQFGTAESGSSRTVVKPNGEVAKPVRKQKRLSLIAPPENIPSREQKIGHRIWFRQRGTLLSFLLFLVSSVSAFLYYVPFLLGTRRSDIIDPERVGILAFVQNIGLAFAAPSLLSGFFMQVKAWYTSLPNVHDYGALFEMNRFITRYPNLIYYVSNIASVFVYIASFVFVLILPLVVPELFTICNQAVLILFISSIILYFAVMTVVLVSVKGLLKEYVRADEREASQNRLREDEKQRLKSFKQAILDCNILLGLVWVGGLSVIVALGIALSREGRRYTYLTFNAVGVLAFLCTSLMVGLISTQTSGGLTPKQRPTMRTTINSSQREGITT